MSVVVLPAPVPPETRMLSRPLTQASSRSADELGEAAEVDQVLDRVGILRELADGELRAVEGERRDDRVDTRPVGKSGVHHRAGLVDAAADLADDLVDGAAQMGLVRECRSGAHQLAVALDVDGVVCVDHDFGQVTIAQERLERAIAEDVVGDLLGDPRAIGAAHHDVARSNRRLKREPDVALQLALRHVDVVQLRAEGGDQLGVDDFLDVLEWVTHSLGLGGRRGRLGGRLLLRCIDAVGAGALGSGQSVGETHVRPSSIGIGWRGSGTSRPRGRPPLRRGLRPRWCSRRP